MSTVTTAIANREWGWNHFAACLETGDIHTEIGHGRADDAKVAGAIHVCLAHCPVLAQCRAFATTIEPIGMVLGGQLYHADITRRRKVRHQPKAVGCGPWCAPLRGL